MLSALLLLVMASTPVAGVVSFEASGVAPPALEAIKARVVADLKAADVEATEAEPCVDQACRHQALASKKAAVMVSIAILRAGPLAQVTVIVTGAKDPRAVERTLDSAKLEEAGVIVDAAVADAVAATLKEAVAPADEAPEEVPPAVSTTRDEAGAPKTDDDASTGAPAGPGPAGETSLMAQLVLGGGFVLVAAAAGALVAGVATAIYSYTVINNPSALSGDKELAFGGVFLGAGGAVLGVGLAAAAAGVVGWGAFLAWE
jgi:hypothetical protein